MISKKLFDILLLSNFFFLTFALLCVYFYAYRLKRELKQSHFLRKETEKYRDLFNATLEGVFQFDSNGCFTIINRSGANMLGYESPQKLLAERINVFRLFADPADKQRMCGLLKKEERIQNQLLKIRNKEGLPLFVDFSLHHKMDEGGRLFGYEGIFHDAAQRLALEEELYNYSNNLERMVRTQTDKIMGLERKKFHLEKLAAVGEMAASLVHELRNPFSSVKMGILTLMKRANLEKWERRVLEIAVKEGRRLERMLKDVLDFARPQELRPRKHDMHRILDQAADQLAGELEKNGIALSKEYDRHMPPILMDPERMQQVVLNLLQNAKDAVQKRRGRIVLRSELLKNGEGVRFEVIDNGEGIRKADLQRIFKPFFSRKVGGTGLGLTVVQKIVEAHKGRIKVESRLGRGTKIQLELPIARTN